MISTLIFLGFLIAAALVAIKTKDKMFVTTQTRYGNENDFQPMWLVKPIGLFLVGMILASIQPYAIEKIDAAICDGDYVVIRAQKDCNNGEIVAAMIDGEATVKTFSRKNGHIWLLPANDDFAPIDGDNCEILGKVTAVLRSVR